MSIKKTKLPNHRHVTFNNTLCCLIFCSKFMYFQQIFLLENKPFTHVVSFTFFFFKYLTTRSPS